MQFRMQSYNFVDVLLRMLRFNYPLIDVSNYCVFTVSTYIIHILTLCNIYVYTRTGFMYIQIMHLGDVAIMYNYVVCSACIYLTVYVGICRYFSMAIYISLNLCHI